MSFGGGGGGGSGTQVQRSEPSSVQAPYLTAVSYTHLTLPTTPYV